MRPPSQTAVAESMDRLADTIVDWTASLIRIPSVTGSENEAQAVVVEILESVGFEVETHIPDESLRGHPSFSDDGLPISRPVVVGHIGGAVPGARSVIFNGHIDVVPPGDEDLFPHGAWDALTVDGSIWGRGACDMKAGLVSSIAGLAILSDLGIEPAGNVMVQSVTGEESGGVGTLSAVARGYRADAAILFEPTRLRICPVGAGSASFRLHVPGLAAHGARRMAGVSAIDKYSYLAKAIRVLETRRQAGFSSPIFGEGELVAPISVGKVRAGDWPSTVPDHLVAEGRAGVLPGESLTEARAEFERAIEEASEGDPWLRMHPPTVEWFEGQFAPAATRLDDPLISHLGAVHRVVTGRSSQVEGVTYGSDLRFFTNEADMAAVLYGPGDVDLAHTVNERVELDELFTASQVAAHFAATWGSGA